MLDTPSSAIHATMVAPGALGVKTIGRLDSMRTSNIWRKTNRQLGRTSPKGVLVDAFKPEYRSGPGIGHLSGICQRRDNLDLEEGIHHEKTENTSSRPCPNTPYFG